MNIWDDLNKTFKLIQDDKPGIKPTITIHHPKCKCVVTQDLKDCNCGGWLFPQ